MEWYLGVWKKYVDFDGRARRKEFWMFALINVLAGMACGIVDNVSGLNKATHGLSPLYTLYALASFLPGLAVTVRRLHDTGKSGWWLLLYFTCVGAIVLLIWIVIDGDPGRNAYGPDPKGGERVKMDLDSEE